LFLNLTVRNLNNNCFESISQDCLFRSEPVVFWEVPGTEVALSCVKVVDGVVDVSISSEVGDKVILLV